MISNLFKLVIVDDVVCVKHVILPVVRSVDETLGARVKSFEVLDVNHRINFSCRVGKNGLYAIW